MNEAVSVSIGFWCVFIAALLIYVANLPLARAMGHVADLSSGWPDWLAVSFIVSCVLYLSLCWCDLALRLAPRVRTKTGSGVVVSETGTGPNRLLKNYLRCHCCVKNRLKMLIYSS